MTDISTINVKFLDSDGGFLVLELVDAKKNTSEIFIDKQAFRFTSKNTRFAVLANMIESINFSINKSDKSRASISIIINSDLAHDKKNENKIKSSETYAKDLGIMTSNSDQEKLKVFLRGINMRVLETTCEQFTKNQQ